jgi:hypothetical protein
MTDTKGLGLLAIFRGGFGGGGFDADWQTLRDSVKFPDAPPSDPAAMRQAGADEAKRLRDSGYEKLLADRVEQWWLWTGRGEHPHLGWSHVDFDIHALSGKSETRLRRGRDLVSRLTGKFTYKDADGGYDAELTRVESDAEDTRTSIHQTATTAGDQLSLATQVRDAPVTTWKTVLPPNYIPGALLPLVIGKINAAGAPLIVRTESFPGGGEAVGAAELLSVLIRPAPADATTRKADGESEPMRCVTAEVNGSGRVSRWYFRKSGELEFVEFPGGVRCVLSDQAAVGFNFGNEKRMTP